MDKDTNDIQNFVAELNTEKLLAQYLKIAMATVLDSYEELAVKIVDRNDKHFGLYLPSSVYNQDENFPVILINGWFAPENGKANSYFNGYKKWETFKTIDEATAYVIAQITTNKTLWQKQFGKKFGDGYNEGFMKHDGSVEIGYKLQSCHSFPECLAISLIHFYYGK